MSPPQETTEDGRPTPRYDNVASVTMNAPSAMLATTITGPIALGTTCRTRMRNLLSPMAFAART